MSSRIVALGGGHGLYATLSAARRLTPYVTAVVTVADDGGSSGRLRSELDVVPPGDLRMALAALASDSPHGQLWATIIQHRFGGNGALAGHPIGNLLLAGLNEVLADPVAALDELGRMLGLKGRVLPMCPIALQIEADVAGLDSDPRMSRVIRGQVAVATTVGKVRRVRLSPGNPPATRQAVDAIMAADLVVLGPGSWFTSVIPHVLVPKLVAALQATHGPAGVGAESGGRTGGDRRLLGRASHPRVGAARAGIHRARHRRRRGPRTGRTRTRSTQAYRRASSMPKLSLLTCPDLVHLYMTRRGWRRRWSGCGCAAARPRAHFRSRRRPRLPLGQSTRGDDFVAMTAEVKDELSRLVINSVSARRAEVASLLRFAGGLHIVAGRVVVEAEVDLGVIARRLRKDIHDLYGYNAVVHVLSASGIRKSTRYVVRVAQDGEALARQTGLLGSARSTGARPARSGGGRQRRRCRSRLARSVFGAWLADRTWPFVVVGGQLPRPGGGAGPGGRGPSVRGQRQGPRGAGQRSRGRPRRGGHRRAADPDGRPGHPVDVGGTSVAPRGAGDGEPVGELRRREPATLGPRGGGGGGAGRTRVGHPRRHRARPPVRGGQAAGRAPAGVAGGVGSARRSADDERRCGRPYSTAVVDGRSQGQAGRRFPTPSLRSRRICSTTRSSSG